MRLQFEKNGNKEIINNDQQLIRLKRITGDSAMIIDSMLGGVAVQADGGEYKLVNEDLSEISINNFT